jgi:capsular polysaccharide export protein
MSLFRPLLRVPPFPGAHFKAFGRATPCRTGFSEAEVDLALSAMSRERVAGNFWGQRPVLPALPYVLVRSSADRVVPGVLEPISDGRVVLQWFDDGRKRRSIRGSAAITGDYDPWHMVSGAATVIAPADDELILIAALAGVPVRPVGAGRFSEVGAGPGALRRTIRDHLLGRESYANPFTGEPMTLAEAVQLCAFWKKLIDGNRPIAAALGFAAWKRTTAAPLLWGGAQDLPFVSRARAVVPGDEVVVWRSRANPLAVEDLERRGVSVVEAEDGFIRSIGLGADCVPPLSLVVDRSGIYFDPNTPSDLETLLERGEFTEDLLDRARRLRVLIVKLGISKYAVGRHSLGSRRSSSRYVLVTGQVEDDRSVKCGGGPVTSNLELLRRVREREPDAFIQYKPHPDVEAGHRIGAIPDEVCLQYADEIVREQPITSLIDYVDEVHVNTSLAGFEALVRGKPVTTHGVPFYAGWGLTRDLGQVPARRTARLTLDELIAGVLLLYPRYLDPATGLPCTPETLVHRLGQRGELTPTSHLVRLRRLQGSWRRRLTGLRGRN